MKISSVVNERKLLDNEITPKHLEKMTDREHPVRIELNPLRPDGNRKVKCPSKLQEFANIDQGRFVSIGIDRVAIPT